MSQKRRNAAALWSILLLAFLFGSCPHKKNGTGTENSTVQDPYPIPADAVNVEITVADSVSGTVVDGTRLVVFDSAAGKQVTHQLAVRSGKVTAKVSPKKKYDFILLGEKGKWAGSMLQDYYVPEGGLSGDKSLMMLQFEHGQITRDVTPPRIKKVTIENESGEAITDKHSIDDELKNVYVEFSSGVGAVEYVAWNGFGARLGIGMMPTSLAGIDGVYIPPEGAVSGVFTSRYVFNIENAVLPNGETELIIVGYDIANNRVEKHIPVNFNKTAAGDPLSNAKFASPVVIMERVPFTNNTFSIEPGQGLVQLNAEHGVMPQVLNPVEGHNSSYKAAFVFGVVDKDTNAPIPIMGFDIFRKKKGSTDEFKFAARTHYGEPKTETRYDWGFHQGFDTSSELEGGKEYEYKIKAFTAEGFCESDVLTGKVMEAFTYSLKTPENRKKMSWDEAYNMSYSCQISNKKLLTKEEADWCDLGLLILDGQGKAVFGSKFRYIFDSGDGTPDLEIDSMRYQGDNIQRRSYKSELKVPLIYDGINSLDDLIKVDASKGVITITQYFLRTYRFNVITRTSMQYQRGVSYQWDIQDWGDNAYDLNDDRALRIVKMYGSSQSRSMGNNSSSGSNAVNGRFTFVIVE